MLGTGKHCRNPWRASAAAERFGLSRLVRIAAMLATMAVSACGGGQIAVERMASLPPDAPKATFVVLRAQGQDRAKDYSKFADQIAGQLAAKGFSRVDAPSQARYAVMFFYDGDGAGGAASEDGRSGRRDRYSDAGKTERAVSVVLYDLTRPERTDEKVFGGRAQCALETTKHDAVVMSALIDAVLKDFPGKAHETYSVSLPKIE